MTLGNALVVLSGGQDSATCLFWAARIYRNIRTLTFDYGQRHRAEIGAAVEIARIAGVPNEVVRIEGLTGGALTDPTMAVDARSGLDGLPSTFLPGRNIVFLSIAVGKAAQWESADVITGVCETDYSGYPDCRAETINSLQETMGKALGGHHVAIKTPLMHKTKAATVAMMRMMGDTAWRALGRTVTCYEGRRPGCGVCPACVLRAKGFAESGERDPGLDP